MNTSSLPPLMGAADSYHQIRFVYDKRRAVVWRAIARYLQNWVRAEEGLLELGAGYGEFARNPGGAEMVARSESGVGEALGRVGDAYHTAGHRPLALIEREPGHGIRV